VLRFAPLAQPKSGKRVNPKKRKRRRKEKEHLAMIAPAFLPLLARELLESNIDNKKYAMRQGAISARFRVFGGGRG
jgi:hypothetical protein